MNFVDSQIRKMKHAIPGLNATSETDLISDKRAYPRREMPKSATLAVENRNCSLICIIPTCRSTFNDITISDRSFESLLPSCGQLPWIELLLSLCDPHTSRSPSQNKISKAHPVSRSSTAESHEYGESPQVKSETLPSLYCWSPRCRN
jgi:hypothetical protein